MSDLGGTRLEGRNGEVWRKHAIYRWTQERCAEHFGISQARVSQIVKAVRESIPGDDLAAMRRESLELYQELTARALEIADMVPAPVFVGKDGSIAYDEDGNVVRDYTGKLRALETAGKFEEQTRKLMGLDSAQKIESTATVKYEVVGVNTGDLT